MISKKLDPGNFKVKFYFKNDKIGSRAKFFKLKGPEGVHEPELAYSGRKTCPCCMVCLIRFMLNIGPSETT